MSPLRVALFCDYAEEGWPSMDLTAGMLLNHFHAAEVLATRVQPIFQHYSHSRNVDRLLNRHFAYPLHALRHRDYDVFHIIDHSYAQLIHSLPKERTVVTCHDTDTFRCLLTPPQEPRPLWFRAMSRHILNGLQKAAAVVCVSEATRSALVEHDLVDSARIQVIHNGVHPAYTSEPDSQFDHQAANLLGPRTNRVELLHVGSTIPRKRIGDLLHIFAACRRQNPSLHLIRVGSPFTVEQQQLASKLALDPHITHLQNVPVNLLAAIYRRAAIVLLPSDSEGFGLPLAEAMACGTPVAISHIPALLEVAGDAASSYPVGDITRWSSGLLSLLEERAKNGKNWYQRSALCRRQASLFSWSTNAREIASLYQTVLAQGHYRETPCGKS